MERHGLARVTRRLSQGENTAPCRAAGDLPFASAGEWSQRRDQGEGYVVDRILRAVEGRLLFRGQRIEE